jgi:SsrA-binding protein
MSNHAMMLHMGVQLQNKHAGFNYEILDTYTAGIVLTGGEVKALKSGLGSLKESFIVVDGPGFSLAKAYIPPYQPGNTGPAYNPYHNRRLLVTKKEFKKLSEEKMSEGLTLIPLRLYNKGNLIKLEFALARGKKLYDKRQTIKKREDERSIRRMLKNKR